MRHHENRQFASRRSAAVGPPLRREYKALQHTAIDAVIELCVGEVCLGPLGSALEGMRVGLEHYSTRPTDVDVATLLHKLGSLAIDGALPPTGGTALVVICRGSRGALRHLPLKPHPAHEGWWRLQMRKLEIHVLEAHRLASDGTWGFVRFAANPEIAPPADLVAELLGDPLLPSLAKERLMVDIMNHTIPNVSPTEIETAADRVRREGREEGVHLGLQLGASAADRAACEAMVALFAPRLTPAELAEARAISSPTELAKYLAPHLAGAN